MLSGDQNFFVRLKNARETAGISQKELGRLVGVSSNTVQSWEKDTYPKSDAIVALSNILGCSIDWLLKGECSQSQLPVTTEDACVSEPKAEYAANEKTIHHHFEIVRSFSDAELAKVANMELLSIERADPAAFREVVAYIKGISNGIRMSSQRIYSAPDRRVDERRKEDHLIVGNRRQGPDRRKAGGG